MSDRIFKDDVIFLQRFLKSSGLYTGRIDGSWGPKTDAAITEFENRSTQIANAIGVLDARSERNIQTLHLKAQERARIFINALLDGGINAKIISGTRTYAEQNLLFKKGRWGNPPPRVTNASGGRSNHNFGIAWDIGIFGADGSYLTTATPYNQAAQIGLGLGIQGLEWGGSWTTFVDRPHYQLTTGFTITQVRERFEKGQPYI